jgi:multidrug efflux system outer membrane protein
MMKRLKTSGHGAMMMGVVWMVSGCTVGPDFVKPEVEKASRWKRSDKVSDAAVPDEWWKLYRDADLNALVERALAGNQDIKAAQARVETARALAGVTRADRLPQLSGQGGAVVERLSESNFAGNLPPGVPLPELSRDRYNLGLNLSYEADLWGRVKRKEEGAKARTEAEVNRLSAQRLLVAAEVARIYFRATALDREETVLVQTVASREESRTLQQSRLEGGLSTEIDVARARTEVELARNDLELVKRQRGAFEHALAVLCGDVPSDFSLAKRGDKLVSPPKVPAGMPSSLMQRRPDLRAAEETLRAANADVGAAMADFYPAFSLTGSAGLESIGATDFINWRNRALSLGPSVTVPIFQGGRLKGNLAAARSRFDESLATYRQLWITALGEVEDAMLDAQALERQRRAVSAALDAAVETRKLAQMRYDKGLASYFEVVDADRTVLTTKILLARIDGERLGASVQMLRALGGGWSGSK